VRRREVPLQDVGALPDWLPCFDLARWVDVREVPPAWWSHDAATYRHIQARRRWANAGRAWLAERGSQDRWYELTRPQAVSR
jgi:hypothetical protein